MVKDPEAKMMVRKQQAAEKSSWKYLKQHIERTRDETNLQGTDGDMWQLFVDTLIREDTFQDPGHTTHQYRKPYFIFFSLCSPL